MRLFAAVLFAAFAFAAPAFAACDLTPIIGATATARNGQALMITLAVENRGDTNCPGTIEAPPAASYMVDIFLSTDRTAPATWAVYNATWREDVLLLGGRVSRTHSVGPGVTARYGAPRYEIGPFTLPTGIPPGDYFLCAGVDLGGRVAESNERNNVACNPIRIAALPRPIDPRRGPTPRPMPTPQPH
ncbi:MAG: hypothetical protein DCF16_12235 [Alphaproteobacteria bacterium]|nr:MAG: hypothetical protein DCF16_12235 [Alphaproteobacteria bacterium]